MTDIAGCRQAVRKRIVKACREAGRDPDRVNLLAVTKARPVAAVRRAFEAGQRDLGENYVQEALAKVAALPDANWHFIGAIQSNKTRDIARHFSWVHSLCSGKIARRLSEQRPAELAPINLLIQVNLSGEAHKSGVTPEAVPALARETAALTGVRLRGLMTMPERTDDNGLLRRRFSALRELRDEVRHRHHLRDFEHLSMGMTNDFPQAIMEGATWIRIGTAIFGARPDNPG